MLPLLSSCLRSTGHKGAGIWPQIVTTEAEKPYVKTVTSCRTLLTKPPVAPSFTKTPEPGGLHGQAAFSSALFPSATPGSLCSSQAGLLFLEKTPPPQGLSVVPAGPLAWTALCQKAMGLPLPL